jgi:uncharacterized protein YndB with AHSA1/START domain
MSDIVRVLTIDALPEQVFHAIVEPDEITHWWGSGATVEREAGSLLHIGFANGEVMTMEVTALDAGMLVQWRVRRAPHDWAGSTITWLLTPAASGTTLLFGHHELIEGPSGYSVEQTRADWIYFLRSLKSYLETGAGTPYAQ